MQEHASTIKRPVVEWADGKITVGFKADEWDTRKTHKQPLTFTHGFT
jgi:arsenate reductase-like glutaredoxin family protein